MSKFENLFNIDEGGISLNKEELRYNAAFKPLIAKGREGMANIMFVYLMGDPRSIYSALSLADKEEEARKYCRFEEGWKPSPILRLAIEEYEKLVNLTPTGKSFLAANKALISIGEDINSMMDNISYIKKLLTSKVNELQSGLMGDDETIILIKECKALLGEIIKTQGDAQKVIKDIPPMNKTVKDLATSWASEGNGRKEIHGGGELNNRE